MPGVPDVHAALLRLALVVALVAGCGATPTLPDDPLVACERVAEADCRAAHREAVDHGLQAGLAIERAIVRPTTVRSCPDEIAPRWDVEFAVAGAARPIVVTVGTGRAGRLAACTY